MVPDINLMRDELLVELAKRNATNGSPVEVTEICIELRPEIDWSQENELARSAGSLLVRAEPPLAKTVLDSDKPWAMLLALTAAGKSAASALHLAKQPKTIFMRVQSVTRSEWISIIALFVSVIALFKGK